ncbi:peptidylprolyl isomerase [Acidovorax sp. Q11]
MMKFSTAQILRSALLCASTLSAAIAGHATEANPVLLQGAGVVITQEQVQADLRALVPNLRAQLLADPEQMKQWLDTVYLRKALAADAERQKVGEQPEVKRQIQQYRETILANARLLNLEEAAVSRAELLEAQARTEYRGDKERFNSPAQTLASHILVKGSDDAAKTKAQELLAELKAGARFEELARKHSGDPGSALRGGSLDWFPAGRMVPEFDEALKPLQQPGDLSPVIKTQFGYHIIRLDGRRPAMAKSYEEVRDELVASIAAKQRGKVREAELERLRSLAQGNPTALDAFVAREKQAEAALPKAAAPAAAPTPTTTK